MREDDYRPGGCDEGERAAAKYASRNPGWPYPGTDRSQISTKWGVELMEREVGRRPIKVRHLQWSMVSCMRKTPYLHLDSLLGRTARHKTDCSSSADHDKRPELVPRASLPPHLGLGRYSGSMGSRQTASCGGPRVVTVVPGEGRQRAGGSVWLGR